jgi:Ni/Fe-hydrogenase 1 B-type cytochrome subunit
MEREFHYEWNLTYRLDHWIRFFSMIVLTVTGLYIHSPFMAGGPESAIMSNMRFLHFLGAYVLLLGLVLRVYLAFRSTFDADWRDFGIWRNLKNIGDVAAYYLFLKESHKDYRRYNPLQALTYLFWAFLILFLTLTGFAIYHGNVFGFLPAPASFQWVNDLLGGESYTRIWHYMGMWVFIITVAIHVYMAIMIGAVQHDHTVRSMITGYRFKVKKA